MKLVSVLRSPPLHAESPLRKTSSPFKYDPLPGGPESPHIRLLELLPGDGAEPLRCNLHVVPLGREPGYEALSYCWGDPKSTHSIFCNDSPFPLAANLMSALEALRDADKPRLLWVDAVCINQGSIEERNRQVAIMCDIYRNATRTIAWLGPEADGSNDALAMVPDLFAVQYGAVNEVENKASTIAPSTRYKLPSEDVQSNPILHRLEQNKAARRAFLALLERPWFSRAWIVQEVAVASQVTLVCGSLEISLEDLAQAVAIFCSLDLHSRVGSSLGLELFGELFNTRRKCGPWVDSLLQLLMRHRWRKATDPRDMVYALAGLARSAKAEQQRQGGALQSSPPPVLVGEPDYGAATVDVFTRVACDFLTSHVGLDLLSAIHPSEPRLAGLPSWAPDWSGSRGSQRIYPFRWSPRDLFAMLEGRKLHDPPGIHDPTRPADEVSLLLQRSLAGSKRDVMLTNEYLRTFYACGDSQPDVHISNPPKTITLSGIVVDIIEEAGRPGDSKVVPLQTTLEWADIAGRAHAQALAESSEASESPAQDIPTPAYLLDPADDRPVRLAWASTIMGGRVFLASDADALAIVDSYLHRSRLKHERFRCQLRLDMEALRGLFSRTFLNSANENTAEVESDEVKETRSRLAQIDAELAALAAEGGAKMASSDMMVTASAHHRRFARARKGYFTLMPERGQVGDEIVVFKGGCMPILVRNRSEIIGECYVHGVMKGEVWREELCREFVIS